MMGLPQIYKNSIKRLFDLLLAVPMLIILSPVLVFIGFLVRMKIGAPVLFRQNRPGMHGKSFTIYKFRTMTNEHDKNGDILPDADRLTVLGRILRSTSLDELPELINVIKNEMSIVGPRPLLMQYLGRYTPEQARRHDVKPGITGWAQVNGRNVLTWDEKFKLDLWYVDNQSLWLDLKIVVLTILKIIKREGTKKDSDFQLFNIGILHYSSEAKLALKNSRFRRAMLTIEISFGQVFSHSR